MNTIERWMARGNLWMRGARWLVLALVLCLSMPSVAWSKPKKQEEAAPTKSYVFPYIIVMFVVGLGIMTICRPNKRKDKPDDKPAE